MKLSLHQIEAQMRDMHRSVAPTLRAKLDLALSAYMELFPVETVADCDGDMLLFQWGTYDWGESRWFEVDLTRQFLLDEEPVQLSMTMRFAPSAQTESLSAGNRWCGSRGEFDGFRTWLDATAVLSEFADRTPQRSALSLSRV